MLLTGLPLFGQQEGERTASWFFNEAYSCYQGGDFACAIQNYSRAITLNADYAEAYINRGHAQFQLENYTAAIEDYRTYLNYFPQHMRWMSAPA